MKKLIPLLLAAVLILSSCGTGNGLDGMAASFEPPLRITARITSGSTELEAVISFYDSEADVTMTTEFTSPEPLTGLRVERRADGSLHADYDGIVSDLDDGALNIVAVTNDILQVVRERLLTDGAIVEPEDERYMQAEIPVNDDTVKIYFDENTQTVLRISSDLFGEDVTIDLLKYEQISPAD